MHQRLPLALSSAAFVVALLGWTSVGQAAREAVLPRNSVGAAQLKTGAVNSAKIKNGGVGLADLARSARIAGPAGPTGSAGPKGDKGDRGDIGPRGPSDALFKLGPSFSVVTSAGSTLVTVPAVPAGKYVSHAYVSLRTPPAVTAIVLCGLTYGAVTVPELVYIDPEKQTHINLVWPLTLTTDADVRLSCDVLSGLGAYATVPRVVLVKVENLTSP